MLYGVRAKAQILPRIKDKMSAEIYEITYGEPRLVPARLLPKELLELLKKLEFISLEPWTEDFIFGAE